MIDVKGDNPSWLSVDTRVFKVKAPQTKFGHSVAAAGSPQQYIQAVLTEFNNGTQNFDTIPAGEDQALLELAPLEDGVAVHNFALARVRMRTTSQIDHVRVMFRLFTTAVTNLSFTPENYPSTTGTDPAALLGRTAAGEIVSIPFFAETRVETRNIAGGVSMETQPDATNERSFPPSVGSAESIRYFGAYLDINADTPRYPQHPAGNGPYPSGECVSIRNILRGQHECMVAEVMYAGDPTEPNVFPATSDNLAQRNLFIIEAANPGTDGSRTVQHSFDLVLGGQRERTAAQEITRLAALTERAQANPDTVPGKVPEMTREARATVVPGIADNAGPFDRVPDNVADRVATRRSVAALWNEWAAREPAPKTGGGTVAFMSDAARRATIDELAIFWHDVPSGAEVEIYMPGYPVDYVAWLRDLRHAPATVRVIDDRTLALTPQPGGVTYLPFAPFQPGRFAGLVTIKLPKGIVAGTKYTVDFIHLRPLLGVTVGAFRMVIPVRKAQQIVDYEARLIDVFTERLATTPADNRWHPILVRQLAYLHDRVHALAKEALEECREEKGHPGEKHRKVRIVLDRIKVLDPNGPLVGGSGKLLLTARVQTLTNGGTVVERRVPAVGEYAIAGAAGGDLIEVKMEIFRGEPDPATTIEIWGGEGKQHCHYRRTIFTQGGDRSYAPSDEPHDSENIGDWQLWYHVEQIA